MKSKKYLIVGTGGVGGCLAGFMTLGGLQVSCIARGEHLEAIKKNGLQLHSTLQGDLNVAVEAFSEDEYNEKADVIIVCVKAYSLESIAPLLRKVSHRKTVIIPVLNAFGTGDRIRQLVGLNGVTVLDGCIYIVSYISAPGEITQMGKVFRMVFGIRQGQKAAKTKIASIRTDLRKAGIKAAISENIKLDTFVKWSYISAMALTGAYFDVPMRPIQKPGPERDLFIALTRESEAIGRRMGLALPENIVDMHLEVLDKLDPESTSSLQKDLKRHHESEIESLLYEMIWLAEQYEMELPTYRKVLAKLKK